MTSQCLYPRCAAAEGGGAIGPGPGAEAPPATGRRRGRPADRGRELAEEFAGQLACRPFDQPRPDLGDLTTDLGIDIVVQDGPAAVVAQGDNGAALGETGHAALPFAGDPVAVRRVDVGQRNLAGEAGADRPDTQTNLGLHLRVGRLL